MSSGSEASFRPDPSTSPETSARQAQSHDVDRTLQLETEPSSQLPAFEISSPAAYRNLSPQASISDADQLSGVDADLSADEGTTSEGESDPDALPPIPASWVSRNPLLKEPSYLARPNRYFGPASTWLTWTKSERMTASSLDIEKAQDLSRHLFNAYVLKRNHQRAELIAAKKASVMNGGELEANAKGKQRETGAILGDTEAEEGEKTFSPPRIWTAWPMPPQDVPREKFLKSNYYSMRRPADMRPSAALEDCLIAAITQCARARWNQRDSEDSEDSETVKNMEQIEKDRIKQEQIAGVFSNDSDTDNTDDPSISSDDSMVAATSEQPQEIMSVDASQNPGEVKMWSSQAFAPSSPSVTSIRQSPPVTLQKPVFSVDDDEIRSLTMQPTRHIILRFEDILLAVHKSRRAYAHGNPNIRDTSRSQERGRKSPSHRIATETTDQDETPSRGRQQAVSPAMLSNRLRPDSRMRSKAAQLQCHDWSTVMGLASILQSFSPQVIARSSERCAKLFGENMLFRTFHEQNDPDTEQPPNKQPDMGLPNTLGSGGKRKRQGPWFKEDFIINDEENDLVDDQAGDEEAADSIEHDLHPDDHTIVMRSGMRCTACAKARSRCEPPPHVGTQVEGERVSCQHCTNRSQACSGILVIVHKLEVMTPTRRNDLVCPHTRCERHSIPFEKLSHLKRHVSAVHRDLPVGPRTPRSRASSAGGSRHGSRSNYQSDRSMVEDDDLIYCPKLGCARSESGDGQPFHKGYQMYKHVRAVHPDLDVNELKRREIRRRGERRGRWVDERRHRSRSRR